MNNTRETQTALLTLFAGVAVGVGIALLLMSINKGILPIMDFHALLTIFLLADWAALLQGTLPQMGNRLTLSLN